MERNVTPACPCDFSELSFCFFAPAGGYGYEGIKGTVVSFMLVAVFYVIPFEKVSDKTCKAITQITRYTLGIYCMHRLVFLYLDTAFTHWNVGVEMTSLWLSVMVYIICWIVSCVSVRVFRNCVVRNFLSRNKWKKAFIERCINEGKRSYSGFT